MIRVLAILIVFIFSNLFYTGDAFANANSYVSVVNPIRGDEFWELESQKPEDAVSGQLAILNEFQIQGTWLFRYDALSNNSILELLKNSSHEKGLFLEITPQWTNEANVTYRESASWHFAESVFLTGYSVQEREKLVDEAFDQFRNIFGYYPKSVGAWWIDSRSLQYMYDKYGIDTALIVADQFSTDNYQIWGQYFGVPYYPSKTHVINPAQSVDKKIPVVITQWATRDPINGYGKGVEESTYSVQANDYIDYHGLDISYFEKLVEIYTRQKFNTFGQLVIGLENSYDWSKYKQEYRAQVQSLVKQQNNGQLAIVTLADFGKWYKQAFPDISPRHLLIADDPLGTEKKTIWLMNPYYRVNWVFDKEGSYIRDLRQYIDGEEELCRNNACKELNFATFPTRVLDSVTYGNKWAIDIGKIKDISIRAEADKTFVVYKNQSNEERKIEFLERDIKLGENIYSIDGAIMHALSLSDNADKQKYTLADSSAFIPMSVIKNMPVDMIKFILFTVLVLLIPGCVITYITNNQIQYRIPLFVSLVSGITIFSIVAFFSGLFDVRWAISLYIIISILLFLKYLRGLKLGFEIRKENLPVGIIILVGTLFQVIPVFRSGMAFDYGVGFWGPNAHDGVWHIALTNQILENIPPENPIFSGQILQNYHYLYNIVVATTHSLTGIPITDLIFRFYPILFSLLLGLGTYLLNLKIFHQRLAGLFSLFFVYFSGSFGWIVEYLREKHFGGESAFLANQAVSFNLNPPFAISLLIVIAIFYLLLNSFDRKLSFKDIILLVILVGSLVGFKAYAAILIIGGLFITGTIYLLKERQMDYLKIVVGSLLLSLAILVPHYILGEQNVSTLQSLFTFSPFWIVHTIIDSHDRVGWVRLSLARSAYFDRAEWLKFSLAELLGLVIFVGGNLGLRIFSIGVISKINKVKNNSFYFFILIVSLLSIGIPLFFIQVGNPWNTIQFFYYFMYISALFAGGTVAWIVVRIPKTVALLLVLFIVAISPINSLVTARGYIHNNPHTFISNTEMGGLNFLDNQTQGVVLSYPYDELFRSKLSDPLPLFAYTSTAYVSGFTSNPVYMEDEIQQEILQNDYKLRNSKAIAFFHGSNFSQSTKFLEENNIRYIYLPKHSKIRLEEEKLNIKNVFENEEVIIYQVL